MENEWTADEAITRFRSILAQHAEHQGSIDDARDTRLRGLVESIKHGAWNAAMDTAAEHASRCATLAHVPDRIRELRRE